jgi:cysteinyl-tRNA synthetase
VEDIAAYLSDLMSLMSVAREHGDWETMQQAGEAMRGELVEIVARLGTVTGNIEEVIGPYIALLLELRSNLRAARQWDQADIIRNRLTDLGIVLEDGPEGTRWKQLA